MREQPGKSAVLCCFIVLSLVLGLNSEPILELLRKGLGMFG